MAEKNIAALLDSKAYTIQVVYQHDSTGNSTYTYICNLPEISTGDYVVVPTRIRAVQLKTEKYSSREEAMENAAMAQRLRDEAKEMQAVLAGQRLTIARVTSVDEHVDIEPDDALEYSWVIAKVDLTAYTALLARNKQITDAVQGAYQRNIRRSFAERVLGELAGEDKDNLLKLLG